MDKRKAINSKGHLSAISAISPYKGQQGVVSVKAGYLVAMGRRGHELDRTGTREALTKTEQIPNKNRTGGG